MYFCLRPSAKDQGITWVVVVLVVAVVVLVLVLLHLVHFLIKRNLREKKSPQLGFEPETFRSTAQYLSTELKWHCYFSVWKLSTYLKNHAADLGPVLVIHLFVLGSSARDPVFKLAHDALRLLRDLVRTHQIEMNSWKRKRKKISPAPDWWDSKSRPPHCQACNLTAKQQPLPTYFTWW